MVKLSDNVCLLVIILALYLKETFSFMKCGKSQFIVSARRNIEYTQIIVNKAVIEEVFDDSPDGGQDLRTDEEKGLTHGYEGSFKVGDEVKVTKSMKIYSVRPYTKEGFDPIGMTGTVIALVLYGRKNKSLCSAITPVKVEFLPNRPGIPSGMFEKKWSAHFNAEELELFVGDG